MRKPLIPLLAALLAACACNAKIDEAILASPDLGIYQDGTALIRYEPLKYQNAYNESLRQFRIHDDTMSEYFILTLDAIPSAQGQKVTGSVKSSAMPDADGLEFTVEKTDGDGRVWLWCKKRKLAVTAEVL